MTLQCRLSDYDRRSVSEDFQAIQLTEAQGVDYFENLCLNSKYELKQELFAVILPYSTMDFDILKLNSTASI